MWIQGPLARAFILKENRTYLRRSVVHGKRNQIVRRAVSKKKLLARAESAHDQLKDFGIDEKKVKNMAFEEVAEMVDCLL
ncbi:hypothetical protein [Paenibacillus agricola]|uniref:hypothetical protein n=1 Tax=Paenibacillus agricola TaxID=2716264 RepID=UPI001A9D6345|nr:hypothetical protein [Paenibacillus agricola]